MTNEKLELIVKTLDAKKAKDIEVLDLSGVSNIGDYFIIATGTSGVAVKSLADEVELKAKQAGYELHHTEGYQTAVWVLLDYGDVVLHIFNAESRAFYSLERLWTDAKRVDISGLLTQD